MEMNKEALDKWKEKEGRSAGMEKVLSIVGDKKRKTTNSFMPLCAGQNIRHSLYLT